MRWERLFQDLEDQLDRETDAELEDIARDEERLRIARLTLIERVRDFLGLPVEVPALFVSVNQLTLACAVVRCGRDWILVQVHEPGSLMGTALLPITAVRSVRISASNSSQLSRPPHDSSARTRHGLSSDIAFSFVLRDLCRRRRHVTLRSGMTETSGTIERVGKDHLDIAVHSARLPRSAESVSHVEIVPLARIDLVHLT
jgi:hypothetical protein